MHTYGSKTTIIFWAGAEDFSSGNSLGACGCSGHVVVARSIAVLESRFAACEQRGWLGAYSAGCGFIFLGTQTYGSGSEKWATGYIRSVRHCPASHVFCVDSDDFPGHGPCLRSMAYQRRIHRRMVRIPHMGAGRRSEAGRIIRTRI